MMYFKVILITFGADSQAACLHHISKGWELNFLNLI